MTLEDSSRGHHREPGRRDRLLLDAADRGGALGDQTTAALRILDAD